MYHCDMKVHINQWGNSLAIRIPKPIAEHLNITGKTQMEMELKGDSLILSKAQYSLESLVGSITPHNLHAETDTGDAVGNEIW